MKKRLHLGKVYHPIYKLSLKMKLTVFFTLVSILNIQANTYSQSKKISLDIHENSLVDVIHLIESKSDYKFLFNRKDIDVDRKISLHVKKRPVKEILEQIFDETSVSFELYKKQIILKNIKEKKKQIDATNKSQQIEITGTVLDGNKQPLPGANVLEKNTKNGITTDFDGHFSLKVANKNAVLIISYIGFETKQFSLNGQTNITVQLSESTAKLDEVVVVGYGTQKKVNLTGSVATVNMKDMKNRPVTNASQALQGVTGAYINQPGGQPGADAVNIQIRGQGTLNDNSPLVLVDGVEYTLSAINPNDIESISVLKDAASAAIYGNRAANGVILVTTKKGAAGKARIEYSNYFGVQQATYLPDVVTDPVRFMELRNQAQLNAGRAKVDYSDAMIEEYREEMKTDPYTYPSNNWLDIMFNNAFIQDHNLRFSGGKESSNYAISLGYQDQDGVLMGTSSSRYSFKANVNFQVKDWWKIGADLSGWYRKRNGPASGVGTLMEMTFKAQGFHPTYLEDGRYANTWVKTPGHNVYRHPLVLAKEGFRHYNNLRSLLNISSEMNFGEFTYNAKIGINKYDGFYKEFIPQITYYDNKTFAASTVDFYTSNRNRHVTDSDSEELNLTFFHTVNWEHNFNDDNHIKVLLGNSYEDFRSRSFSATVEGFLGNDLTEIDAGSTNPNASGTSTENVLIGFFGRVNYDFKHKYLLEANLRYDGSSRFAQGNRWGVFPSVSLGWRLDQEDFLKDVSSISNLKLRASYGSLGNQEIGNFRYVNLINTGYDYSFGGTQTPGAAVNAYNDPSISWETTTVGNLGIDATVFDHKLDMTFEYYDKRTKDILRAVNLPSQVGNLGGPIQNIGEVSNKGWELSLNHKNTIGEFSYQVGAGINFNKNKVVNLNQQQIINGRYITKEGAPIDSYYLLEADGIFQNQEEIDNSPYQNSTTKPGYIKYKDQNGDGVIDQDDRVVVKGVIPDYTYSLNFSASYKNFTLSGFFQGVEGVYTYPQGIIATPFWYGTAVTKNWVNNSWTPDNPNASLPILTTYEDTQDDIFRNSTFWLKNASYLRLKNIEISYAIPQKLLKGLGIEHLLLFVNGQNLLTFSKMKDFDPERNIKQGDYYEYPTVKMYTAGINVTF
ncbi:TonB-dependent receptor [Zhouia sp. PK063]|uniref:TonB-dependent receptor n=1 Tax=Zhouia sp. PK063 TaxID=3373602 RepID=UPI0037AB3530